MKLNLETNSREQELVKAYLEENASETLAEKINNGTPFEKDEKTLINKKTLDGFMKYASNEARKLASKGANSACVEDKVVYGWAVHYFEEDSIEGTLLNDDGTEYKPAPKSTPAKVKKVEPKKPEQRQPTLFDFMEPQKSELEVKDDDDEQPSQEEIDEILAEIAEEENKKATQKKLSPFYEKYLEIEHSYPDCVITYRLGDFYEVFGEKAVQISEECNLTLTGRDVGLDNRIPMVGFPYHAAELYFDKIQRNHRLVVVNSDGTLKELSKPQTAINLDTGEIYDEMTEEEEMREFDGDIEEPQDIDDEPEDSFDTTAFDKTAVVTLVEIFGDKLSVR